MISKPIKVKALDNYRIWLEFEDSTSGEVDLSHLAGKGVFGLWDDYSLFKKVFIDNETFSVAWNNQLEIDPNNLYLKLIGKTFD